jgi:hypothetical protein
LMLAKEAALLPMSRLMLAKEAALLLAVADAGEGGCTAVCCGGCWRRWLRCCMSRCALGEELALLHAAGSANKRDCAAAC